MPEISVIQVAGHWRMIYRSSIYRQSMSALNHRAVESCGLADPTSKRCSRTPLQRLGGGLDGGV